jgi:hypothetical protein
MYTRAAGRERCVRTTNPRKILPEIQLQPEVFSWGDWSVGFPKEPTGEGAPAVADINMLPRPPAVKAPYFS